MVGSLGLLSNRSLRGPRMFSSRTLVYSRSCIQYPILKIRECGLSFSSRVRSVTSFTMKRGQSEEVLIFSGSVLVHGDIRLLIVNNLGGFFP